MFIFSSQTRLAEAWLVAGWRAAQIISGTNDPNAALILSLIYLPRPACSRPGPEQAAHFIKQLGSIKIQ